MITAQEIITRVEEVVSATSVLGPRISFIPESSNEQTIVSLHKKFEREVGKVFQLVEKKKLGKVLSGLVVRLVPDLEGFSVGAVGGYEFASGDILILASEYPKSVRSGNFPRTLLHEVGHRCWYNIFDYSDRREWTDFVKGTTKPLENDEIDQVVKVFSRYWDKASKKVGYNPQPGEVVTQLIYFVVDEVDKLLPNEKLAVKVGAYVRQWYDPVIERMASVDRNKEEFLDVIRTELKDFKFWNAHVSWYANENPLEAWSEAFASHCLDKKLPSEVLSKIEEILEIAKTRNPSEMETFSKLKYELKQFYLRVLDALDPSLTGNIKVSGL
jgi:hypothetical protein